MRIDNNRLIQVGIIGCGKHFQRSHMPFLFGEPDAQKPYFLLTKITDINTKAMQSVLEYDTTRPQPKMVTSEDEIFADSDIDAVMIMTPPRFHLGSMEKAVAAGKHVFCEKPFWMGVGEIEKRGAAVIKLAHEKGLVLTSCHPRRFEFPYLKIKHELQIESIKASKGELLELHYNFFYRIPPTGTWRMHDSLLLDHLNHEIDIVNFLIGHSRTKLWRMTDGYDRYQVAGYRDDGIQLVFSGQRKLEDRLFINELVLVYAKKRFSYKLFLNSEDGQVYVYKTIETFDLPTSRDELSKTSYWGSYAAVEPFELVMENFARSIRNEENNYLTPQDLLINTIAGNRLVSNGAFDSSEI